MTRAPFFFRRPLYMKIQPMAVIITLLLISASVTATVAENCRIKNNMKCANGSTIALTTVLAVLVAVTAVYWMKPVYFPA